MRTALVPIAIVLLIAAISPGAVAAEAAASEGWSFAWHGYAFLDANRQDGPSGEHVFESVNHFMLTASRPLGAWTMALHGTFTLEPATIPPEGSPLLFQRGETYNDTLLIDRQHAHDLFVRLGASWERPLRPGSVLRLEAGLRGEPAVGPVAYPHRPSASEFPMAPLSHHNIDSTHISDDVITAGYTVSIVTIEGSVFHGAEPDEDRWDLDQGSLDSYAGRVSVRLGGGFSAQVSACRRESPEALEDGNQTRQTASVSYERRTEDGFVAALAASGRNLLPEDELEWGHLVEAVWNLRRRHFLYARWEQVDRDLFELTNKMQRPEGTEPARVHVEEATIGYAISLPLLQEAETAAGAALQFYRFDDRLDATYGDRPVSLWGYLRFRFGSQGKEAGGHTHH